MLTKYLLSLLSVIIGSIFLYSAYTKLFPIQRLEYTMVDTVHLPWLAAAIAARFFIGLEAALGLLILSHFYGKRKWVLKTALMLVATFTIYLLYLWATKGNNINCGCFGDDIWMSPGTSVLKNILLISGILILLLYNGGLNIRKSNIIAWGVTLICLLLPYILFAVPGNQPDWLKDKRYKLDLSALYAPEQKNKPIENLQTGRYIISFFSPGCPHCQLAAYKMHLMKLNDTTLPFFFVIGGHRDLKEFWDKTQAQNIHYARLDQQPFVKLAGTSWPAIYFVANDTVVATANYATLSQEQITNWLRK